MAAFDPYQAPAADLERDASSRPTGLAITETMIDALRQTRPWVLFLAILGFIGSGFMVLASLMMVFVGVAGASMGSGAEGIPLAAAIGLSIAYLVFAAIYVLPCLHLLRFGTAIGRIRAEGGAAFEDALLRQRSFWRTVGIMTIAIFALYVLAVIVVIAVGVVAGARGL